MQAWAGEVQNVVFRTSTFYHEECVTEVSKRAPLATITRLENKYVLPTHTIKLTKNCTRQLKLRY